MLSIEWPWLFLILPLPWLIWRFMPSAATGREAALYLPFFNELSVENRSDHGQKPSRWLLYLAIIIWLLLVTSAARPQWVGDPIALPLSGRDILIAIDVSGSMETPDFNMNGQKVTRLDVVKTTAGEFIQRREGDNLGLILFGSQAYLQTPLTFDRATVKAMLDDASIGLAGKDTAIGDAIGLAVKRLREDNIEHKVLVLLTDGANTSGEIDPLKAAELATTEGLKIYTIGIGADSMEVGSFLFGSQTVNPSRDLDETTLKAIAQSTGGQYFRARNTQGLEEIYQQLDELEPRETDSEFFRPTRALFHWPLGLAFLLSLLPPLLSLTQRYLRRA